MKSKLFLFALSVGVIAVVIAALFPTLKTHPEPAPNVQTAAPRPATRAELYQARQQEFVGLVKAGSFIKAKEFADEHNVYIDATLMNTVSEFQIKDDVDPQVRFNVIDFFLKHGRFGNAWNPDQLRLDYRRLVRELQIPDSQAAFLEETDHLHDLSISQSFHPLHKSDSTDWEDAFAECVAVLNDRPEDTAAWRGLHKIMKYSSRAKSSHLSKLQEVCRTPWSKIRLANLVVECNSNLKQLDQIVEAALPELANDSLRSSLLYRAGFHGKVKRSDEQSQAIATRIIESYPKTSSARSALQCKLAGIATSDVDAALAELGAVTAGMELTKAEIDFQKYAIAGAAYRKFFSATAGYVDQMSQQSSQPLDQQRRLAKELLDKLIETGAANQTACINLRVQIADAERDLPAMDRIAAIWMKANNESPTGSFWDTSNVAPTVARHYSATGRWQLAHDAWQRWPASHGGCGSWGVFPSEIRVVRMTICQLHLQQYPEAVKSIAEGMTDRNVDSRRLLPLLLFHIYRRANQADDFWAIMAQWNANEAFREFRQRSFGGDGGVGMTIDQIQSQRENMEALHQFAEDKNWRALIGVCRLAANRAVSASHSTDYQFGSMLETSVAAQASVLLSEAAGQGAIAIEEHYRNYLPNVSAAERAGNDWWIVRSLLENESAESEKFLMTLSEIYQSSRSKRGRQQPTLSPIQQLAERASRSGAIQIQNLVSDGTFALRGNAMLREFFHWKPAPAGSLPKHIPLVLSEK